jgi:hypothetical protein
MKIEFKTSKNSHYGDDLETHSIYVNGEFRGSASENIEPEDCKFYRDLYSPMDFSNILNEVIAAVKSGEEVEIEYSDEEDE